MTNEEIVCELKTRLNTEGAFRLTFEVSRKFKPDDPWTLFFVKSNADRSNRVAERQLIAEVEQDIQSEAGREILVVPVPALEDVA